MEAMLYSWWPDSLPPAPQRLRPWWRTACAVAEAEAGGEVGTWMENASRAAGAALLAAARPPWYGFWLVVVRVFATRVPTVA